MIIDELNDQTIKYVTEALDLALYELSERMENQKVDNYHLVNKIIKQIIKFDNNFVKEQLLRCYRFKDNKGYWGDNEFIIGFDLHYLIKTSSLSFLFELYSELFESDSKRLVLYSIEGFVYLKDKRMLDIIFNRKNFSKIKDYLKNDIYLHIELQITALLLNPNRFIHSLLDSLIDLEHLFIFDYIEYECSEDLKERIIGIFLEFDEQTISNLIDYVTKNETFWNLYFILFILLQKKDHRIFDFINHLIDLNIFTDTQTIGEVFNKIKTINSSKFKIVLEKMMRNEMNLGLKNFFEKYHNEL